MKPYNIVSALFEMAAEQPNALAIAFPEKNSLEKNGITRYQKLNFKELAFETNCMGRGLLATELKPGDRVVMMVPPGFNFFILAFAMLQTGIVPVFIDPGIGINNIKKCIAKVEPRGFIGISKAHLARIFFGWGKDSIQKTITIGPRFFWGGKTIRQIRNVDRNDKQLSFFDAAPGDTAAIIFTSGSTGLAKGVVYSHGNFKAQLDMIRTTFNFSPGEIDMPSFPPFALFNPALGMASIIPDMDASKPAAVNPKNIIGPILQFGITNMFGSPALIDTVGRYGKTHNIKLPSLKRVISAGAPASTKSLMNFSSMLETGVEILTPYGSTEAMPVAKIGSHKILTETQKKTATGSGVCIGKSVKGMEIDIIHISDEEIPTWSEDLKSAPGVVGEIVVKGDNVTRTYYNSEPATKMAKIKDGDQVRHRMGDLGYFDAEKNLWFCGRKEHRVKVGDEELYSIPCEYIFNTHPDVFRTALVGVNGKAVLCVEIEKPGKHISKVKLKEELERLASSHSMTNVIRTILFHPAFPVDFRHNAKIIRENLAHWAKKKLK